MKILILLLMLFGTSYAQKDTVWTFFFNKSANRYYCAPLPVEIVSRELSPAQFKCEDILFVKDNQSATPYFTKKANCRKIHKASRRNPFKAALIYARLKCPNVLLRIGQN